MNEVRILASVNNPYVVSYKEAFYDDSSSSLCIIMDFAGGGDLLQKISSLDSYSRTDSLRSKQIVKLCNSLIIQFYLQATRVESGAS